MSDNTEELVDVEIELSDEDFLHIAKMAHENDITFNKQFAILLRQGLDHLENLKDEE